jgi:hypothetical protein
MHYVLIGWTLISFSSEAKPLVSSSQLSLNQTDSSQCVYVVLHSRLSIPTLSHSNPPFIFSDAATARDVRPPICLHPQGPPRRYPARQHVHDYILSTPASHSASGPTPGLKPSHSSRSEWPRRWAEHKNPRCVGFSSPTRLLHLTHAPATIRTHR